MHSKKQIINLSLYHKFIPICFASLYILIHHILTYFQILIYDFGMVFFWTLFFPFFSAFPNILSPSQPFFPSLKNIYLLLYPPLCLTFKQMQFQNTRQQNCEDHGEVIELMCLDEQCKDKFLLCKSCQGSNIHKHSKTSIVNIEQVKKQVCEVWEVQNAFSEYKTKINTFYEELRKELLDVINEDEKKMQSLIQKLKYYHLPLGANSQTYISLQKDQYEELDKINMIKLINEAENGQLNDDHKQDHFIKLLNTEFSKLQEKIFALKFMMPSNKFQTQLMSPSLSENSKICSNQEFGAINGLLNSRGLLIRYGKLIYHASEYEFSPKSFYNNCNDAYNCLVVCKLQNNKIIGGFSTIPLVYHEEQNLSDKLKYESDSSKKNFLFTVQNLKTFSLRNHEKAIAYRKQQIGPIFGEDLNMSEMELTSELGNSYRNPQILNTTQCKVHLLNGEKVKMIDFEVWRLSF